MLISINQKYLLFILLIISIFYSFDLKSNEVKIITKIENEIITNIDVKNEYNYLVALNKDLQGIDKKKILNFARESLIKEKIKKIEVSKYFELDNKNEMIDIMIEKIYRDIGINSRSEFENYLQSVNLNFNNVYKKIEIEAVWNQLIYSKYKDKVIINENEIRNKIKNNPIKTQVFLLSELIYEFKNQNDLIKKNTEILNSIRSKGFKETVINYSIAESKNKFGSIGWVNKNALSKNIRDKLEKLNIGETTQPVVIPAGALILKIDDIKIEQINTNIDNEVKKIIQYETNTQLNNYSTLYFNKIKNNLIINEY